MDKKRRNFLKLAGGAGALLLGGKTIGDVVVGTTSEANAATGHATEARGKTRWAMVINVAECHKQGDCNKCAEACHLAHNVPDFGKGSPHEVKWIWKAAYENVFPDQTNEYNAKRLAGKPVLALCNHCENPPCVRVCPTKATWKREDGIVAIDMHRCIGCRFCIAACPYGSRSCNWVDPNKAKNLVNGPTNENYPMRTMGVVEKCTFCIERVEVGMQPKCVEVCPAKAMRFGNLEGSRPEDLAVKEWLESYQTIRRKPALGTGPEVFYII
jgi:molybdopterin-containing oxidoreductase family iron-sulfur binding subunit